MVVALSGVGECREMRVLKLISSWQAGSCHRRGHGVVVYVVARPASEGAEPCVHGPQSSSLVPRSITMEFLVQHSICPSQNGSISLITSSLQLFSMMHGYVPRNRDNF